MIVSEWQDCYNDQWTGLIVPEAFSHPAKFAPGLIKRIYEHCIAQGYIYPGQLVLDCFAGVSGGGIFAPMFGLRWVGVELEATFCELSKKNFALHERKWKKLGKPIPQIIQGDSRLLSAVLSGADCILTSPPFLETLSGGEAIKGKFSKRPDGSNFGAGKAMENDYGHTEGQLGAMKAGDISMVCTSPPFMGITPTAGDPNYAWKFHGDQSKYGPNPSNLGNLPAGKVENVVAGIVTSPPWENNVSGGLNFFRNSEDFAHKMSEMAKINPRSHGGSSEAYLKKMNRDSEKVYGTSLGQIGQQSGNTYWEAVRDVYAECYKILKPGGVLVVVVKSYVKSGRRVPLPMQTLKLLIHLGFEPLERIKAMLVKEESQPGLFGEIRKVKERKSFFRRNHEFKQAAKEYWPTIPRDEQAKYLWNNRHKSKKRTRVIEIAQCAALNSYRKKGNTIHHLAKKNRIDFEEVLVCKRLK